MEAQLTYEDRVQSLRFPRATTKDKWSFLSKPYHQFFLPVTLSISALSPAKFRNHLKEHHAETFESLQRDDAKEGYVQEGVCQTNTRKKDRPSPSRR